MKKRLAKRKTPRFLALVMAVVLLTQFLPIAMATTNAADKVDVSITSEARPGAEVITITAAPTADNIRVFGITLPDNSFVEASVAVYTATENGNYFFDVCYSEAELVASPAVEALPAETPDVPETLETLEAPETFEAPETLEAPVTSEVPTIPEALVAEVDNANIGGTEFSVTESSTRVPFTVNSIVSLVETDPSWFKFDKTTGTITDFKNEGYEGDVIIPKEIDGVPVIALGNYSFANLKTTSITIPEGVTTLGDTVFGGSAVTSLTIPESVTDFRFRVFSDCPSLTSITLPKNMTGHIGNAMFAECTSLASITIPDGVTSIGTRVFSNCTSLTSVILPKSLTSMESEVFAGCTSLTSVTIPEGVTVIQGSTFGYSTLKDIYVMMQHSKAPADVTQSEPWGSDINITTITYLPETHTVTLLNIPDENFRKKILEQALGNRSDPIEEGVAVLPAGTVAPPYAIYSSDLQRIAACERLYIARSSVASVEGIEYFSSLVDLGCYKNDLRELDLSQNLELQILDCDLNQLTTLDVSNNKKLWSLRCAENQLDTLNIAQNKALRALNCYTNNLTEMDLSPNESLELLYCGSNKLTTLDVSSNYRLFDVNCPKNQLVKLNLSTTAATSLTTSPQQREVTLSELDGAYALDMKILVGNANLAKIENLTAADATMDYDPDTGIATFATMPTSIQYKYDTGKSIRGTEHKMEITLMPLPPAVKTHAVQFVDWDGSPLGAVQTVNHGSAATAPINLPTHENRTFEKWDKDFTNVTEDLTVKAVYKVKVTVLNIPDENFRKAITELVLNNRVDPVADGSVTLAPGETAHDTYPIYSSDLEKMVAFVGLRSYMEGTWRTAFDLRNRSISDLTGIAYFSSVKELYCNENQITSLDVSSLSNLEFLACRDNNMTSLNVKNLSNLVTLYCSNNLLAELDLTGLTGVRVLNCRKNLFSSLDLDDLSNLTYFYCDRSRLVALNMNENVNCMVALFELQTSNPIQCVRIADGRYAVDLMQIKAIAPTFDIARMTLLEGATLEGTYAIFNQEPTSLKYEYNPNAALMSSKRMDVTIPVERTAYTVTFVDWDGSAIGAVQTVSHGSAATAPASPERTGYTFTGWDKAFDNVTGDMTVTAQYAIKAYAVQFADWDGSPIGVAQTVNHGSAATAPAKPERVGYTFSDWDKAFGNVTSDMTVAAQYSQHGTGESGDPIPSTYAVKFIDWDGTQLGKTQYIHSGTSAKAPSAPMRTGYTFTGWDKEFTNVRRTLTVTAQYSINLENLPVELPDLPDPPTANQPMVSPEASFNPPAAMPELPVQPAAPQPEPPAYSTKEVVTPSTVLPKESPRHQETLAAPPVDLVSRESDGLPAPAQPDEQEIVLENTLATKSELVNEVDNGENAELSAHERNSEVHVCILHWMLLLAAGVLALYGVLYHNKDKKDKMPSSR